MSVATIATAETTTAATLDVGGDNGDRRTDNGRDPQGSRPHLELPYETWSDVATTPGVMSLWHLVRPRYDT
jgi:hypothetical protein